MYTLYLGGLKWKPCYKKSRVLASARVPPLVIMVMKMAMDIMVMDHCNVMLVSLGNEVHCRDHMVSGEMEMSQKHKQRCKWAKNTEQEIAAMETKTELSTILDQWHFFCFWHLRERLSKDAQKGTSEKSGIEMPNMSPPNATKRREYWCQKVWTFENPKS